jgi:hypothetical protein
MFDRHPLFFLLLLVSIPAHSATDPLDLVGFRQLQKQYGSVLPDGADIVVMHVEAAKGEVDHDRNPSTPKRPRYFPGPVNKQLSGKSIRDMTGHSFRANSAHARGTAKYFYGNTGSMVPGVSSIDMYSGTHWLAKGFLWAGSREHVPEISAARVASHSWTATGSNSMLNADTLGRVDWLVESDELIHVVGMANAKKSKSPLLGSAYNVISVGVSSGNHATGTHALMIPYAGDRPRPHIVVPISTTSDATAVVASAATLLVALGHSRADLSTDPVMRFTNSRAGNKVFNAERSEVIKAVLMAGADRQTNNPRKYEIDDYRIKARNATDNGLDRRFGAGQLNILHSYRMLVQGEQNSAEDQPTSKGRIESIGFDYDPAFVGKDGNKATASYFFSSGDSAVTLTASLVWNYRKIELPDRLMPCQMTLSLYQQTDKPTRVAYSDGLTDTTQNLWVDLQPHSNYRVQVDRLNKGEDPCDYALAWYAGHSSQ